MGDYNDDNTDTQKNSGNDIPSHTFCCSLPSSSYSPIRTTTPKTSCASVKPSTKRTTTRGTCSKATYISGSSNTKCATAHSNCSSSRHPTSFATGSSSMCTPA